MNEYVRLCTLTPSCRSCGFDPELPELRCIRPSSIALKMSHARSALALTAG